VRLDAPFVCGFFDGSCVELVGRLPAEAQFTIQFVAAVCTNSTAGQSALALIGYLSSPEAMPQSNRQGQQGQACCQEQEEVRS